MSGLLSRANTGTLVGGALVALHLIYLMRTNDASLPWLLVVGMIVGGAVVGTLLWSRLAKPSP